MSKVGNYIVGASVVAVMMGNPNVAEAQNVVNGENKNKIENVQELKEELKNDSTIAWNQVAVVEADLKENKTEGQSKEELKEELKNDSWEGYKTIKEVGKAPRIENLQYRTDTITKERYKNASAWAKQNMDVDAYYRVANNTITDNVHEGRPKSEERILSILAHEAEHMHQHEKVNFSADMSLEQHYKLHSYTEIGAQIAGLLQLREMYKEAKTEEEKKKIIKNGKDAVYRDYFEAIEKGELNPQAETKEDFDKEMKFIANSVSKNWMNVWANEYDDDHLSMVVGDISECDSSNLKQNDENYKKGVQMILTMGGIDFSSYLDNDIECHNKSMLAADNEIKNGKSVEEAKIKLCDASKFAYFEKDESLKGFSLEQQYILSVHKFFVEQMVAKDATFLADIVKSEDFKEEFNRDIQRVVEQKMGLGSCSIDLICELAENKGNMGKATDKEFQEKLREIWTVKDWNGNNVCLLDGLDGKAPNFEKYVATPNMLKDLDKRSFPRKVVDFVKEKIKKKDKPSMGTAEGSKNKIENTEHLKKPLYEYDSRFGKPLYSEMVQTSEVIDTRTNFLKEERESKIEKAGKELKENLAKIHPKTEIVKENNNVNAAQIAMMKQSGGR